MNIEYIFEGYEAIDYEMTVKRAENITDIVFDCFCGSMSAIEAETYAKDGLNEIGASPLSFEATRTLQLVSDFDDFINTSDFNLRIEEVGKLEMEHFWRVIRSRNSYKVANYGKTYGNSGIYQIAKNKKTIGFLLNNMTFDGQNSYYLWSLREKQIGNEVFSNKGDTLALFFKIAKYPSFIEKLTNKIASNGETAINAWSVLESKESRSFYTEMKKHDWLNDGDKALLKAIRKMDRVASFDSRIEAIEARILKLKEDIAEYEESEDTDTSVFDYFDWKAELEKLEDTLVSYGEEHNSEAPVTTLEDYKW